VARILIIDGHPDTRSERLIHALAQAYAEGAGEGGHEVRRIDVGALDLPPIRSVDDFTSKDLPPAVAAAQGDVSWAEHLVILHPLWLGSAPALLKGWFEQVFRYGFAIPEGGRLGGLLKGRSARIIVTMGMPNLAYTLMFGGHGVKSLERSVLNLSGVKPVRHTYFGGVGAASPARRGRWLAFARELGRRAR
jgi:putative NADPH-quinone reductase